MSHHGSTTEQRSKLRQVPYLSLVAYFERAPARLGAIVRDILVLNRRHFGDLRVGGTSIRRCANSAALIQRLGLAEYKRRYWTTLPRTLGRVAGSALVRQLNRADVTTFHLARLWRNALTSTREYEWYLSYGRCVSAGVTLHPQLHLSINLDRLPRPRRPSVPELAAARDAVVRQTRAVVGPRARGGTRGSPLDDSLVTEWALRRIESGRDEPLIGFAAEFFRICSSSDACFCGLADPGLAYDLQDRAYYDHTAGSVNYQRKLNAALWIAAAARDERSFRGVYWGNYLPESALRRLGGFSVVERAWTRPERWPSVLGRAYRFENGAYLTLSCAPRWMVRDAFWFQLLPLAWLHRRMAQVGLICT